MKFYLAALVLCFSFSANAHFQLGTYTGKLTDGTPCSLEIKSVEFKDGVHHPLNERVNMIINFLGNADLEFQHLPQVNLVAGTVRPKEGVLSNVKATAEGAEAIELIMNEDGPVQMVRVRDFYKHNADNDSLYCTELEHQ